MKRALMGIWVVVFGLTLAAGTARADEKTVEAKVEGRLQNDWMWGRGDDGLDRAFGRVQDGNEFRRARLGVRGTLYERIGFRVEYDFAGGETQFKDAYMEINELGSLGTLRMGHTKEPFSLEEMTPDLFTAFMERALPNVFVPSRNTGFVAFNCAGNRRMTWAAGVFRDTNNAGDGRTDGGAMSVTGRVTFLPWYDEKGRRLLHLGASYSFRNPVDDSVKYESKPELRLAPRYASTGTIRDVSHVNLFGVESALVNGPWWVQGEYMVNALKREDGGDNPVFSGYYVMGGYFLTGESKPYRTSSGVFDRLKPKSPLKKRGGRGAWEAVFRFSSLDLNDAGITGGTLRDYTLGLNWYLNPNARIAFNYLHADRDDIGQADFFVTRFHIDF
jgi:phosphate-selective porin OprO/OprP